MIFFVDDDRRYIKDYIEELTSRRYEVEHRYNIDDAFTEIIENHKKIELLVVDMMMPPGDLLEDRDHENGKRTGMLFVKKLEEEIGEIEFPLILFTHVNIERLNTQCRRYQKEDHTPDEFANIIEKIINKTNKNE
jgi:CheY-like chemotaxis protein